MEVHTRVPMTFRGRHIRATVEVYSRGGTKSPTLHIVVYRGRRYVPKKMVLKDIRFTFTTYLCLLYNRDYLRDLVYKENPFLKLIPKDDTWVGKYLVVPLTYGQS